MLTHGCLGHNLSIVAMLHAYLSTAWSVVHSVYQLPQLVKHRLSPLTRPMAPMLSH